MKLGRTAGVARREWEREAMTRGGGRGTNARDLFSSSHFASPDKATPVLSFEPSPPQPFQPFSTQPCVTTTSAAPHTQSFSPAPALPLLISRTRRPPHHRRRYNVSIYWRAQVGLGRWDGGGAARAVTRVTRAGRGMVGGRGAVGGQAVVQAPTEAWIERAWAPELRIEVTEMARPS